MMERTALLPRLSGSALKVVAMLSMVVDHAAFFLLEDGTPLYEAMRCVGRIAFPVFAFLIAEGFRHTRSRRLYFFSLLFFAAVSELPWYLLGGMSCTHNVMFTLALGVLALAAFEKLKKDSVLCLATVLSIAALASWLGTDYEWRGVLMIAVFYMLGQGNGLSFGCRKMAQVLCAFPLIMHYGMVGALLAVAVICLYDGTRGFIRGSEAKYAFYAFYPLHLLLIAILFRNQFL